MSRTCVLALDLGTSAFKAAPVDESGALGRVTVAPYALDRTDGRVTCDPERYVRAAYRALRGAARTASHMGLAVEAIGISSQAQTFVPLDARGEPAQPALVWTDDSASAEAAEAEDSLPDFRATSGFLAPSPLQFLPKAMRCRRECPSAERLVLLNEWVVYRLTGKLLGDTCNQGMGGFYDVSRLCWNARALDLARIGSANLADIAPGGSRSATLTREAARAIGIPPAPVYSCGNDQSCAAIGAGLERPGDVFANFGTAMVVYALRETPALPADASQIAGISPLPDRWFLLAVEPECGNLVEGLSKLLYRTSNPGRMIDEALALAPSPGVLPVVTPAGGGQMQVASLRADCTRAELARGLLDTCADRLDALLQSVAPDGRPARLFAGGGLSRSAAWLEHLGRRCGTTLVPTPSEHPGLLGVARIIRTHAGA